MFRGRSDAEAVAGFQEQNSKEGFKISGWLRLIEVIGDLQYGRVCKAGIRVSFWTECSNPEQNSPFLVIRDVLVFIAGVESFSHPII